jgi:hypothetical protein
MKTSAKLRRIASLYISAAGILDEIDRLCMSMDGHPAGADALDDDHEPTAMLVEQAEPPEPPHADKAAWLSALVGRLGCDPYEVSTTKAMRERVEQARSEAELDDLEAGEKSRGDRAPAKAVRQGVLDAIAARRALLRPVEAKS